MELDQFKSRIAAIEFDPRPRFTAAAEAIVVQRLRGVPAEIARTIYSPRLDDLATRAELIIEHGNFGGLNGLLGEFSASLAEGVSYERREGGRLYTSTPRDEVNRRGADFHKSLYNGHEQQQVLNLLKPGERIVSVGLREIRTDERIITREDLRKFGYSRVQHDPERWNQRFTAESKIREAEAAAGRLNEPEKPSTSAGTWPPALS